MHHSDYIDNFMKEFNWQVEEKGTPTKLQINLCNKVSKELFCQEPKSIQESLHQENQVMHDELTAEYNAALKSAPPVDQEGQDE